MSPQRSRGTPSISPIAASGSRAATSVTKSIRPRRATSSTSRSAARSTTSAAIASIRSSTMRIPRGLNRRLTYPRYRPCSGGSMLIISCVPGPVVRFILVAPRRAPPSSSAFRVALRDEELHVAGEGLRIARDPLYVAIPRDRPERLDPRPVHSDTPAPRDATAPTPPTGSRARHTTPAFSRLI